MKNPKIKYFKYQEMFKRLFITVCWQNISFRNCGLSDSSFLRFLPDRQFIGQCLLPAHRNRSLSQHRQFLTISECWMHRNSLIQSNRSTTYCAYFKYNLCLWKWVIEIICWRPRLENIVRANKLLYKISNVILGAEKSFFFWKNQIWNFLCCVLVRCMHVF